MSRPKPPHTHSTLLDRSYLLSRRPSPVAYEITEKESGGELVTRVSELSVNGCYIDEQNPFPSGTIVTLKIFSESEVFDATAKVLYAHPNLGMGLVFQEVSLRSDAVLREWLRAAKALEEKSHS